MSVCRDDGRRSPPADASKQRYLINNAVITAPGTYNYKLVVPSAARRWLDDGPFVSAIGYNEVADALHVLVGLRPTVERRRVHMLAGDEALVFRLTVDVGAARAGLRGGRMDLKFVLDHHEFGVLRRVA